MNQNLQNLLSEGVKKGYFEIDGNQIKYLRQGIERSLSNSEEKVRAGIFFDLLDKYGYENDKEIIDLEYNRTIGHPHKKTSSRVDIILNRPDGTPYTLFELKTNEEYERYFEKSIKTQLFERAANEDKAQGHVKYLIYYTRYYEDGELVEKYQTIDYEEYKSWEDWEEAGRPNLRLLPENYEIVDEPPEYIKDGKGSGTELRENVKVDELNRIATDLHNVLYGGGQHQNDLFYNLIGLFLTKIYDEKVKAQGEAYGFQIFFEGKEHEDPQKTYDRINKLYKGEWIESEKNTPLVH